MDCLAWLRNILWICGKYENIYYMIVTIRSTPPYSVFNWEEEW